MDVGLVPRAALLVLLLLVLDYLRIYFRSGLRNIPGPLFARVSGLYRISLVRKGDAPAQYRRIHEQYGQIVRTGPNHVSVSDPAMIPVIYGIGSKYGKV